MQNRQIDHVAKMLEANTNSTDYEVLSATLEWAKNCGFKIPPKQVTLEEDPILFHLGRVTEMHTALVQIRANCATALREYDRNKAASVLMDAVQLGLPNKHEAALKRMLEHTDEEYVELRIKHALQRHTANWHLALLAAGNKTKTFFLSVCV